MLTEVHKDENNKNFIRSQGKVKVTDLLFRLNKEKKNRKKKKFSFRCCGCFSGHCFWNNFNNLDQISSFKPF